LIARVSELISEDRIDEADEIYSAIKEVYNGLDKKYKEMIHDKCIELYHILSSRAPKIEIKRF
jgi:hypothetical protein